MPRVAFSLLAGVSLWLASIGVFCGPALAQVAAEPVNLDYRAPATCPSSAVFFEEVQRSAPGIRLAASGEPARRFEVLIDDTGLAGRLIIDGGAHGTRASQGADCAEVTRLLAFATALAIDPDAMPPGEPSAPPLGPTTTAALPPATPRTNARTPSLLPTPAAKLRWSVGAHGLIESASAPHATFGGGLFADLAFVALAIQPSLRLGLGYGTSRATSPAGVGDASVSFHSTFAVLEACPLALGSSAVVSFRPCLRAEGGTSTATGHDIPGARSVVRPWLALGAAAHFRWSMGARWFGELSGGALFPTVRDRVFLAPDIDVHRVPAVGALGELALGFRL